MNFFYCYIIFSFTFFKSLFSSFSRFHFFFSVYNLLTIIWLLLLLFNNLTKNPNKKKKRMRDWKKKKNQCCSVEWFEEIRRHQAVCAAALSTPPLPAAREDAQHIALRETELWSVFGSVIVETLCGAFCTTLRRGRKWLWRDVVVLRCRWCDFRCTRLDACWRREERLCLLSHWKSCWRRQSGLWQLLRRERVHCWDITRRDIRMAPMDRLAVDAAALLWRSSLHEQWITQILNKGLIYFVRRLFVGCL